MFTPDLILLSHPLFDVSVDEEARDGEPGVDCKASPAVGLAKARVFARSGADVEAGCNDGRGRRFTVPVDRTRPTISA